MKILDLFAGVGGMSLGFEMAGFETLRAIDIWADAINTLNHNQKKKRPGIVSDIETFNKNDLKNLVKTNDIAGVIGGPPCQGFSTARLSDNGVDINIINRARNSLYLDFYNTVKIVKPAFFVIENVRGMVSMNKGAFVKDILERFGKLGFEINFEIVNAANYGVPQNRHRVLFVGIRKELFLFPPMSIHKISTSDALSDLPMPLNERYQSYQNLPLNLFQKKIRKGSSYIFNHEPTNHSQQTIEVISKIPDGGSIKSLPKEYWEIRKFNKAFQRMNSTMPSLTIDTGHRNYFHYSDNRIPTVREAARLQSFPDKFEFLGSRTSQYKQVGNAVPPQLAHEIALQIKKQITLKDSV
jgi:DNA (cytosine-5)-methyltransferase 1